ncbi:hypothetical protein HU200_053810 [Digitaria exilis]|uniref:Uncharacterized protein n=1 Tax=Digitaria exilis TaxID=1010633 RepID=A0A835AM65_9POAL|nr:hypothetical protein HU200_053810 [Digitaria exilis]
MDGIAATEMLIGHFCQRDKEKETRELREKTTKQFNVPLPDDELLFGTILEEYIKEKGCKSPILEAHDTLIKYWRLNRILYPRPLSQDERDEKQRKLEKERQVQDRAREAQLEAMRALVGDLPSNMTFMKGALERSSDGVLEMRRDAHREAVRALGSVLRKKDKGKSKGLHVRFAPVEPTVPQDGRVAPAVNKGKGAVVIIPDEDDGWGDDEILSGCESD